ncbi:MAG: hypothetical protein HYS56_04520, partial [Candidatus Omnitrophica bacterium]|nr:hypothetical protein [Candidatus Omnitrophota bacterium]
GFFEQMQALEIVETEERIRQKQKEEEALIQRRLRIIEELTRQFSTAEYWIYLLRWTNDPAQARRIVENARQAIDSIEPQWRFCKEALEEQLNKEWIPFGVVSLKFPDAMSDVISGKKPLIFTYQRDQRYQLDVHLLKGEEDVTAGSLFEVDPKRGVIRWMPQEPGRYRIVFKVLLLDGSDSDYRIEYSTPIRQIVSPPEKPILRIKSRELGIGVVFEAGDQQGTDGQLEIWLNGTQLDVEREVLSEISDGKRIFEFLNPQVGMYRVRLKVSRSGVSEMSDWLEIPVIAGRSWIAREFLGTLEWDSVGEKFRSSFQGWIAQKYNIPRMQATAIAVGLDERCANNSLDAVTVAEIIPWGISDLVITDIRPLLMNVPGKESLKAAILKKQSPGVPEWIAPAAEALDDRNRQSSFEPIQLLDLIEVFTGSLREETRLKPRIEEKSSQLQLDSQTAQDITTALRIVPSKEDVEETLLAILTGDADPLRQRILDQNL